MASAALPVAADALTQYLVAMLLSEGVYEAVPFNAEALSGRPNARVSAKASARIRFTFIGSSLSFVYTIFLFIQTVIDYFLRAVFAPHRPPGVFFVKFSQIRCATTCRQPVTSPPPAARKTRKNRPPEIRLKSQIHRNTHIVLQIALKVNLFRQKIPQILRLIYRKYP
jgi:hypothetical protein